MADKTNIEWTEATWNPITGCSVTSPGCTNCYAMKLAGTRLQHHWSRKGLTRDSKAGPVWTGETRLNEEWLDQPLRWKRQRLIFVCAHGDLFHESVPDEWIDRVFAVMALAPQHTFQVLTKRSARMRQYVGRLHDEPYYLRLNEHEIVWSAFEGGVPKNIWLGVSVEDQARAEERIPDLLATPAAVRWLSCEPLLGPVDLTAHLWGRAEPCPGCPQNADCDCGHQPRHMLGMEADLAWIVAGGESGPGARGSTDEVEAHMRSLRDQCAAAGVSFFAKQNYKKQPLPADLQIQQFPAGVSQ